jgi:serine/threonine protein kinase
MEHLQELIFTDRIYEQSMLFLQKMQLLNEIHGDISPGNVMQDSEGNVKFIDFSRSKLNIGTDFYSQGRNDKQAMAIVLLNYKYTSLIKEHYQQLGIIHNNYKYTLDKLYKFKELDEIKFFEWFEVNFPQDEQSYKLLKMINI